MTVDKISFTSRINFVNSKSFEKFRHGAYVDFKKIYQPTIDAMKAEGWTFASHTYGHLNAESADLDRLQADHERWVTVNEPILGKVDKIIFAFGADIGHVGEYTGANRKFQYFKSQGMNIFCNVDGNIGWTEFGDTFMRTGRVALDGFTMYQAMTENAAVHSIYANDYETLGISGISEFFNQFRPTPIDSE